MTRKVRQGRTIKAKEDQRQKQMGKLCFDAGMKKLTHTHTTAFTPAGKVLSQGPYHYVATIRGCKFLYEASLMEPPI